MLNSSVKQILVPLTKQKRHRNPTIQFTTFNSPPLSSNDLILNRGRVTFRSMCACIGW